MLRAGERKTTESLAMLITRCLVLLAVLTGLPAVAWNQEGPVQFTIAETHPAFPSRLGVGDRLWIRLTYRTTRQVRFWAEAYGAGQKISAGGSSNVAPPYPPGEGEALIWISFHRPTAIDELRIEAVDEGRQSLASIKVPARVEWSTIATGERPPEWAERLNRKQEQKLEELRQSRQPYEVALGLIIIAVGYISILGYLVVQPVLAWRWSGGWRIAALLPLLAAVPLFGQAWLAFRAGSNLWPILLIYFMPLAFLYLAVIAAVRWFVRRPARP
jgi:hypothetical protein